MENKGKKNIKVSLFMTDQMDDFVTDLSISVGMSKCETIRAIISQYMIGYKSVMTQAQQEIRYTEDRQIRR